MFVLWNLATAVGAVAGEAVGDPRTFGLDAAVGAAFLALLWPRLKDRRNILVGVLAAAVALATGAGHRAPAYRCSPPAASPCWSGVLGKRQDPTEIPGTDDVAGGHH